MFPNTTALCLLNNIFSVLHTILHHTKKISTVEQTLKNLHQKLDLTYDTLYPNLANYKSSEGF